MGDTLSAAEAIAFIRSRMQISQQKLSQLLGLSFVSINRWERGASSPSPAQHQRIMELYGCVSNGHELAFKTDATLDVFASRGVRCRGDLPLFESAPVVSLNADPGRPILQRITQGKFFAKDGSQRLREILRKNVSAARTLSLPPTSGMSAGKNTYTYDAHTYHTKVPPQGIAELLTHYLPEGGLVLDPFSGSGMTGVAARALGYDCILNELSPAACFISNRFTSSSVSPDEFEAAVHAVIAETADLRRRLYTTQCRECGRSTELLYAVWSSRATDLLGQVETGMNKLRW